MRSQWEAHSSEKLFSRNKNWFCQSNLEEQRKGLACHSCTKSKGNAYVVLGEGSEKNAEKKVTLFWFMNSSMGKPGKLDHLHWVYHFTVPFQMQNPSDDTEN